ncbi:unnamed protein product, partial [Brassica rapa]
MTSKLRFTKKKKESPPKKKNKSSPTKKKEVEPAKKEMTLPTGKKKQGRSSSAEEHEADDGGSSSQPTKRPRLTSNRNPKNLQPNPAAASASATQPDNEETPLGPPATSEDPPPTKRQNPPHQQDPPDAYISRSSTKGGTPYSEQGDNEEVGSHGEPPRSPEPNATEEQIMEIYNILKPTGSESDLSVEIFDDGLWDDLYLGDDGDRDDPIVDGWNKIIIHDQAGCESLETRVSQLEASMKVRDDIIGQLEARIKSMDDDRNPRDRFGNMEDLFDHMIVLTLVEAKKMSYIISFVVTSLVTTSFAATFLAVTSLIDAFFVIDVIVVIVIFVTAVTKPDVPQSTDQYMEPSQHGVQDVLNISTEVHVFYRTRLDLDHARLDLYRARLDKDHAKLDLYHARLDLDHGVSQNDRDFSLLARLARTACTDDRAEDLSTLFDPIMDFFFGHFSKARVLKLSEDMGFVGT